MRSVQTAATASSSSSTASKEQGEITTIEPQTQHQAPPSSREGEGEGEGKIARGGGVHTRVWYCSSPCRHYYQSHTNNTALGRVRHHPSSTYLRKFATLIGACSPFSWAIMSPLLSPFDTLIFTHVLFAGAAPESACWPSPADAEARARERRRSAETALSMVEEEALPGKRGKGNEESEQ